MENEEPKSMELEQELDALYRKVASVDKIGNAAHSAGAAQNGLPVDVDGFHSDERRHGPSPGESLKAAAESEELYIPDRGERGERTDAGPPGKAAIQAKQAGQAGQGRRAGQARQFFRTAPVLAVSILLLCIFAFFLWPSLYQYDDFKSGEKVYKRRISRLTGDSAYSADGVVWRQFPIPEAVAPPTDQIANVSAAAVAVVAAPAEQEIKTPAAGKRQGKNKYAIQIISFPEDGKNEALAFIAANRKKGLPAIAIETVPVQGSGVWHRVLIGQYAGIKDASFAIRNLKLDDAYPGCFVQKKSGK